MSHYNTCAGHVPSDNATKSPTQPPMVASASALAAARALRGDEALMMGGIIKERQSSYGVI